MKISQIYVDYTYCSPIHTCTCLLLALLLPFNCSVCCVVDYRCYVGFSVDSEPITTTKTNPTDYTTRGTGKRLQYQVCCLCTPENYLNTSSTSTTVVIRTLVSTGYVTTNSNGVIILIQWGTHTTQLYSYARTAVWVPPTWYAVRAHSTYTGTSTSSTKYHLYSYSSSVLHGPTSHHTAVVLVRSYIQQYEYHLPGMQYVHTQRTPVRVQVVLSIFVQQHSSVLLHGPTCVMDTSIHSSI